MKTEQEQIEEMAKQMCGAIDNPCIHDCTPACGAREYAKRCFKAGYRKQSDTAREILQYLYEKMGNVPLSDTELVLYLATQYGVEGKDE